MYDVRISNGRTPTSQERSNRPWDQSVKDMSVMVAMLILIVPQIFNTTSSKRRRVWIHLNDITIHLHGIVCTLKAKQCTSLGVEAADATVAGKIFCQE